MHRRWRVDARAWRGDSRAWGTDFGDFGPWARSFRFFSPGELRLALLSLLQDGPKHGYELMKTLQERSGGAYRASAGSVYPTLQQLEDEGLVTSQSTEGKRVYCITAEGRAELEREAPAVRRIWERTEDAGDWADCMGPEIVVLVKPIGRLMKSAFRAISARADDREHLSKVQDILERAAEELERLGGVRSY
jgi:DNA-binding PadR family transcriptional regulator